MIAKFWRYLKIAKFAYLGWAVAFVLSLVGLKDIATGWWYGQAACILGITVLVVGIQWFMESRYGRLRKD